MFAAPESIVAEVFAELPESLRVKNRVNDWIRVNRHGEPVHSFLEGPSFDRQGNLYVTDIPYGRILRVSPAGKFELVTEYDGEPNGLKIHKDGRIFIADHKHGIVQLDPASGKVTTVVDRPVLERFKGCNDLVFASNGDLYFTDQGQSGHQDPTGRVYRLSAGGDLEKIAGGMPGPNGLTLNLTESIVYVGVTRANAVWRVPMLEGGGTAKVGTFIQMSGGAGPDGLALNEDGGLTVAHPQIGSVWLFDRYGEPRLRIKTPAGRSTTNIAYGGPENKTVYITEGQTGAILRATVPYPGQTLFSHM